MIHNLPDGWEVKTLGDVCEYDKQKNNNQNLPYVGLEHIEANRGKFIGTLKSLQVKSSTFHFSKNHLLYGRLRPYLNKVLLPDFEGHCSTEIFPIKVNELAIREFIFYWLTSEKIVKNINSTSTGARMPRANMKEVINFPIPIPPLIEQKAIAKKLDACFSQISQAKTNLEQNLQNTKDLFQSTLNQIFQNPSDDWEVKTLGEVCTILNGGTPKTKHTEYWNGDILWITPKDMGKLTSMYVSNTHRTISKLGLQKSSAKLIPKNSLILSTRAPIGYLAINTITMTTNQGCRGIVVNKDLDNNYLFYFLGKSVELLNELGVGTTFKELSTKALSSVRIPIPSLAEQKAIVKKLNTLSTQTKTLEQNYQNQLKYLEELKKSILQKAFKGKL